MIKWLVRIFMGSLALAAVFLLSVFIAFKLANRTNGSVISSGINRVYYLYVPEQVDGQKAVPLVISIHGYAEWPAHQMQISHWNDLADQYGFIVVYPSGTGLPLRWSMRPDAGGPAEAERDVVFISDLMDKLEGEYNIDPNRIYANGLSNGGGMSFVLSCRLSERIAAVGLVSGAYLFPWEQCSPSRPVPAVIFHGTDDRIVPFEGGPSKSFDLPFPSIVPWVGDLANRNGCSGNPSVKAVSGTVSETRYAGCAGDVLFYTIQGGGHAWPGGEPLPEWIAGFTTQEINATRVMWDFFQAHPLTARE